MDKLNKAKGKRAAKRLTAGVTASTYISIEQAPTLRQWQVSQSQSERFKFIAEHFEGFFAYQAESGELDIFPPNTACVEDFFSNNKFNLEYGCLTSFVRYYASGVQGGVSLSGCPVVKTVLGFWASVVAYVHWRTGAEMPLKLYEEVRQFIWDELATELGSASRKLGWLMRDDIHALAKSYLDPNFPATTIEARVCMLAWQAITVQNNVRRSSLVKSEKKRTDQQLLQWGDCEIRIMLPPALDAPPIPLIFLTTPNAKTKASKDTAVVLEPSDDVWEDPVHHMLLLAHLFGAFPTGWTYEQMYDRQYVEQRIPFDPDGNRLDHLIIKFSKDQSQTPVFQSPPPYKSVASGCVHWTSKQFYSYMRSASELCGFDSTVGPHVLRRSGVNGMKVAGESMSNPWNYGFPELMHSGATNSEISQQLRQKWSGYTFQRYTGDLM
jgi:hypothetical protein